MPYTYRVDTDSLALTYYRKSLARRKALNVLFEESSYADTVRESQEICELLLKGVLRLIGIEPPKFHDVGKIIKENSSALSAEMRPEVDRIARYSFELRRDRELAFYGALDVDPWEDYTKTDAEEAMNKVDTILSWSRSFFERALGS
ncbi:MAG: HEPN domain-containing protein [Spirochaetaceae bacterium]|nr:MAG: HEPN domain-containing protein [Spirochaetaceae bacterium]